MMKRVLSVFLVLACLLALFPVLGGGIFEIQAASTIPDILL